MVFAEYQPEQAIYTHGVQEQKDSIDDLLESLDMSGSGGGGGGGDTTTDVTGNTSRPSATPLPITN